MSVVARFYVAEVHKHAYATGVEPQRKVILRAACRGEENKSWAQATPSGTLEMLVNNGPAGAWFEDHLGGDIEIRFAAAEEAGPTKFS